MRTMVMYVSYVMPVIAWAGCLRSRYHLRRCHEILTEIEATNARTAALVRGTDDHTR